MKLKIGELLSCTHYVLKALHSLAHGKAMGINTEVKSCPVGATQ